MVCGSETSLASCTGSMAESMSGKLNVTIRSWCSQAVLLDSRLWSDAGEAEEPDIFTRVQTGGFLEIRTHLERFRLAGDDLFDFISPAHGRNENEASRWRVVDVVIATWIRRQPIAPPSR